MELAQRIRLARRHAGYSQTQLAERVGVRRSSVGHWESGFSKSPTQARLQAVSVETGVHFEWLATGRGAMLLDPQSALESVPASTGVLIEDPIEERLIHAFRGTPARARPSLLEVIEVLAAQQATRRRTRRID